MASRKVTIGSRGSPLALWQANWIKDLLHSHHSDLQVDIKIIKTGILEMSKKWVDTYFAFIY